MKENYAQAAIRHWHASGKLAEAAFWQEAAYLAGYVGECGLKAVLVTLGGTADPKRYSHDLTALSGEALATAAMFRPGIGRYLTLASPLAAMSWRSEMRYERESDDIVPYQQIYTTARTAGMSLIFNLILDGGYQENIL